VISKNQAHAHAGLLNEPCAHCKAENETPLVELPGGYYVRQEDISGFFVEFVAFAILVATLLAVIVVLGVGAR
jgi:hypothetical protein